MKQWFRGMKRLFPLFVIALLCSILLHYNALLDFIILSSAVFFFIIFPYWYGESDEE